MSDSSRRVVWAIGRVVLGVLLLAWVLLNTSFDARALAASGGWFAGFCVFPFFGAAIESVRLRFLMRPAGYTLGFLTGWRLCLTASALNLGLPGSVGGDVLKAHWLAREVPGRGVEVAMLVVLDRACGLLALMLLSAGLAISELDRIAVKPSVFAAAMTLMGLAIAGLIAAIMGPWLAPHLAPTARRLPLIGPLVARVLRELGALRGAGQPLLAATCVTLLAQMVLYTLYAFAGRVITGSPDLRLNGLLATFSSLAALAPVTPGGVGIGEATLGWMYAQFGFEGGAIVVLLARMGQLPAAVVGLLGYARGFRSILAHEGHVSASRTVE